MTNPTDCSCKLNVNRAAKELQQSNRTHQNKDRKNVWEGESISA